MASTTNHKQAAIDQWTADPCGAVLVDDEPGSRRYFERLLEARHDHAPWIREVLDAAGTRGRDVLDVGCGQGIDLYGYAAAGARATGIDLTPRHCELARRHLAAMNVSATVVDGDGERLPFEDASFDRASSNGVLHHTPDMPAALREIHRVLRLGGEATIIVYNRSSLHYWVQQVAYEGILMRGLLAERSMAGVLSRGVEHSGIGARPLVLVHSPRRMRRMMREAGFSDVSTVKRHFHPGDTFVTELLAPRFAPLRDPKMLDRIGRAAGWYVVARGVRSA
jgi:ubiquinone/menaquinone biosynthesis C-methylase UbiE